MFNAHTILCPTDFSAGARLAFRLASQLADAQGSRLVVLHVLEPPDPMVTYSLPLSERERIATMEKLGDVLHHHHAPAGDVQVEHRLLEGEPVHEILRLAEEVGCGLIVMGTHGRTGFQKLILGSVAERVVRKAHCPVVTVKVPHEITIAAHVREEQASVTPA